MSSEYLTSEMCNQILQNRFNNPDIEYIKNDITPISEHAEGYMGEHMNVTITYKLQDEVKTEVFFMKRKPTKNKVQSDTADACGVFKHEIFLYDVLLKEFDKYGLNTSFAPKSFYCIPDQALILENVKIKGFNLLDRHVMFNTETLQCLLKNLAMYHAAGFVYEKIRSKELNKDFKLGKEFEDGMKEMTFIQYIDKSSYMMKFWNGGTTTMSTLIDLLPEDKAFITKFKSMFLNYEFGKIFVEDTNFKKTCGHGDLWSNNMMFKTTNGELEIKLCDFQSIRYFYPAFDVILAIFSNTDTNYRNEHLDELYKFYYESLSKIVQDYGYDVKEFLTLDEFYQTIALVKVDALMQVVFTNTLIYMSKEKLDEHVESEEGLEELFFKNDKIAAKNFQNNELFRSKLSEGIYDLYDALFNK